MGEVAGEKSAELFERARRVIPGGVNSPVRAFGSVGGTPYFVASGSGSRVLDVDGNEYVDYVQSWGASILGHAHPAVVEAVTKAAQRGTTYGAPTEAEVLMAETICSSVEGCDELRLVSSGTEATMTAVRLARAVTGRDRVVKFAGCYHGHSDALLAASGSGIATLGIPGSAGVPKAAVANTLVVPYGVVPDLGDDVACVVVEPVAANMGLVVPPSDFLRDLREACARSGALLVLDEVITGFRLAKGAASGLFGVEADLWTFGKVIGGGLPLAAVGGRGEIMELLAPCGPVYQAGTLSGNPLATAAGLAVLARLEEDAYEELSAKVARLAGGLRDVLSSAGLSVQVPFLRSLSALFFSPDPVADFEGAARAAASGLYPEFFHAMLRRGIAFPPSPYEVIFCSLAHSDEDIDRTLSAAEEAAGELTR